jgi:glycosyltransferase involved in cell wall biosynthesis
MKIALVSQEYPLERVHGGIGTQTFLKARGLSDLGHEIYVISRSPDFDRHEIRDTNFNLIRIPGMEDHISEMTDIVQWLTYSTCIAAEINRLNRQVGLDLIDFPEWGAEGFVYLLNRTGWYSIPVVIQLHGPLVMLAYTIGWPDRRSAFYRTGTHMEAVCVQLADALYSSGECTTRWVRHHYHPGKNDIPVIHTGVDTTVFSPLPVNKNKNPLIIFIGKIVPNKGVVELVEAAIRLSTDFPGLRLRMIGKGEDKFILKLKEKAEYSGAQNLLEFPGFLPREALPEELCRADIFAAPSWYEGGPGFVYLEAMACGLPVIGCSGSGMEENIIHGYNGLLVPPKNTAALEQTIRKIMSDNNMLVEIGRNARLYAVSHCDRQTFMKKIEEYYLKVIDHHRSTKDSSNSAK